MKRTMALLSTMVMLWVISVNAQGYGGALTFQGVDRQSPHSFIARAMGGVTFAAKNDIGSMFQHPAILRSVQKVQIAVGDGYSAKERTQRQEYAPVRYYANLSLLLEGLTAQIPNPDTTLIGFTAQDTVQRPFDDIGPNWSQSHHYLAPLQVFLAVPIPTAKVDIIAGLGVVEYADLNHYYQNNNVLTPNILSLRPLPTMRPTDDNPLRVAWSQELHSREGTLHSYGMALAVGIGKNVSMGVSGQLLRGRADDYEGQVSRGTLTFFANAFRADSTFARITKTGTSSFRGQEFTLSAILSGRTVTLGLVAKLPTTITRTSRLQIMTEQTGSPLYSMVKNEDKLTLPWRGMIGLAISPRQNLTLGFEYEWRPYAAVKYREAGGQPSSPWLSASLFRMGAEYRATMWLILRGGIRGEAKVFEPEGNAISGYPVTYTVYSGGIGVSHGEMTLNLTYEHYLSKYQDIWSSAISKNRERSQTILAQMVYTLPWLNP